jgi:hypothetical protein
VQVEIPVDLDRIWEDHRVGMSQEAGREFWQLVELYALLRDLGPSAPNRVEPNRPTFSRPPTGLITVTSSLSCAPATLTNFHIADMTSERVPSCRSIRPLSGASTRNRSG